MKLKLGLKSACRTIREMRTENNLVLTRSVVVGIPASGLAVMSSTTVTPALNGGEIFCRRFFKKILTRIDTYGSIVGYSLSIGADSQEGYATEKGCSHCVERRVEVRSQRQEQTGVWRTLSRRCQLVIT